MTSHAAPNDPFEISSLAAEMTEEIVLLSNENPNSVYAELKGFREKARHERSPDVAYLTLLHRKYAQVANSRKDSMGQVDQPPDSCLPCLPNDDSDSTRDSKNSGCGAIDTKLFRLRAMVAVLSLITFAVMSSAPYIYDRAFWPEHHFHRGCNFRGWFHGKFEFRGYRAVIAVGVICFVHNAICLLYSALPYIPGSMVLLGQILKSPQRAAFVASTCAEFCAMYGAVIAVLLDFLLFIAAAVSFAVSQYIFELAVPASVTTVLPYTGLSVTVDQYYTLSSCYLTYSHQTPTCLDERLNPTSKISASLTLWFFATVVQLLCFLYSWRNVPGDIQPDSPSFEQAQRLRSANRHTTADTESASFLHAAAADRRDMGPMGAYSKGSISSDSAAESKQSAPVTSAMYSIVGEDRDELIAEEHRV